MAEPQLIKSLDKGLRILEIIGNSESPVSISQLSRMLGMNRSSIFRLLATLKRRGFVINPVNSKAFVLGSAIRTLSNRASWRNTLMQISRKYLLSLAERTGETAHIAMLEGSQTIIIDNEMSPQSIGVTVKKGDTGLIYCTSVGKALILDHSREDVVHLLGDDPLAPRTHKTIRSINSLVSELNTYRPSGYVIDDEEYNLGVRCIGVPIRDVTGKIVAALGISAPLNRMPESRFPKAARIVIQIANGISSELGAQVPMEVEQA